VVFLHKLNIPDDLLLN